MHFPRQVPSNSGAGSKSNLQHQLLDREVLEAKKHLWDEIFEWNRIIGIKILEPEGLVLKCEVSLKFERGEKSGKIATKKAPQGILDANSEIMNFKVRWVMLRLIAKWN